MGPAGAQRLPAFVSSAEVAIAEVAIAAPRPLLQQRDSVPRHTPDTYWLTGAVVGMAVFGLLGASWASGFCGWDDSDSAGECVLAGVEGLLLGATVGFPIGGLIGGAFPRKPRPPTGDVRPAPPDSVRRSTGSQPRG